MQIFVTTADMYIFKSITMEKLTSIRLQPMININKPDLELICIVLKFGQKKSGEYKFPIVFKEENPATQLYDELKLLIGKSLDEVKTGSEELYEKYKQFDYRVCWQMNANLITKHHKKQ